MVTCLPINSKNKIQLKGKSFFEVFFPTSVISILSYSAVFIIQFSNKVTCYLFWTSLSWPACQPGVSIDQTPV